MPLNNLVRLQLAYISALCGKSSARRLGILQSCLSGVPKLLELHERNKLFTLRRQNDTVSDLTTESIRTICS